MQRSLVFASRLIAVAASVTLALAVHAQTSATDSRWVPWIGCWQPSAVLSSSVQTGTFVCITHAGAGAVEIASIDSGRVLGRDTIDATGAKRPMAAEGCEGWRSAEWSADGRRVYSRSELNCSGGITRVSSSMLAFASSSDWIDVQNVSAAGTEAIRSVRYSIAGTWASHAVPAEFAGVLAQGSAFDNVARSLAASEVKPKDVLDASKHVDASVVETWLIDRDQAFDLNARTLMQLADAGVPGSVTDVMIGVSYPDRFVVTHDATPERRSGAAAPGEPTNVFSRSMCTRSYGWDPYWYPPSIGDPCYRTYMYGYDPYFYDPYRYGYAPVFTGYYSSPVIVVDRKQLPHGKMVNGEGYTRGGGSRDSGTRSSPPDTRGSSGGSPPARTSSSSGKSTSGSSSSGRTAHKKGG